MTLRRIAVLVLCVVGGAAGATPVSAGDRGLLAAIDRYLPLAQRASRGDVQGRYDAARTLEEALLAARPVGPGCTRLLGAGLAYARGEVLWAEGIDRGVPSMVGRGRARANAAERTLKRLKRRCEPGPVRRVVVDPGLVSPASGAVVVGPLVARVRVPAGVDRAVVLVNGRVLGPLRLARGTASGTVATQPGRYKVAVRLYRGKRLVRVAAARNVWVLPASAAAAAPARGRDRPLDRDLTRIARAFPGYAGVWVHDLRTGRTAGWNANARFPAASTVKLGVLVAALRLFGPHPERSRVAYDLAALTGWSSNLAANRVLVHLGDGSEAAGIELVEATLRGMGAASSTYTGLYRVGTSRARGEPPLVSRRVTTARDLGRILYLLHAGALGSPAALRDLRLTRHEAEVGLGLLLSSQPEGDNAGLLRPSLAPEYLVAQKNGWINDARHTAAVLYAPGGPEIVVVLTYRGAGLPRAEATALGARILARVRH